MLLQKRLLQGIGHAEYLFVIIYMVVAVDFSYLAKIWEEGATILPRLRFKKKRKKGGDELVHTISTFKAGVSPQWLKELRRLWPIVP